MELLENVFAFIVVGITYLVALTVVIAFLLAWFIYIMVPIFDFIRGVH